MIYTVEPIAKVKNSRTLPIDDNWSEVSSEIILLDHIPINAFKGIEKFSHLEILYLFNQVNDKDIIFSGRPRGNPDYPETGIFAQRKKDRPNRIGICTVELVSVEERILKVKNLDAINGTPVLDIKPVFREFLPKGEIRQPAWVTEMMKNYWE